ncbi:hypothetical protein BCR43DRAFT_484660 [Syncephalastrum racemosum]|uniref:CAP-Gly domain-containing protein n=1 Tax=Syncephalastrum racemosum TaxID=13706 RepID=A0A1X2HKW8_SYNRA|nr:hypothetical protein BCR43DRAFT_484660 [Syncephalastrum racemosum]
MVAVGDRIQVDNDCATIRFIGPVTGSKGEWLGVEWDDPSRGKHDGTHQGVSYFKCSSSTSGSFIRNHPTKVLTGKEFLPVLIEKYLDQVDTGDYDATKDRGEVVFGANRDIKVETVGFEKIKRKQRMLSQLAVVGLRDLQVAYAGPFGKIAEQKLGIRDLDLSKCLVTHWDTLADIVAQLPHLRILRLNQTRLLPPPDDPTLLHRLDHSPFTDLTTLALSGTRTTFADILRLEPLFPHLEDLQLGACQLSSLETVQPHQLKKLKWMNLEENEIQDWEEVAKLGQLQSLDTLYLNHNRISQVHAIQSGHFERLEFLRLDDNALADLHSLDMLNALPSLTKLRIKRNPVFHEMNNTQATAEIMGRIARLHMVNGTTLTSRERDDFERYYLSRCVADGTTHDAIAQHHPRYRELCTKHGEPDLSANSKEKSSATLNDRLIEITLSLRPRVDVGELTDPSQLPKATKTMARRLLGTMLVRNLRHIIRKLFNIPASQQQLYLLQHSETRHVLMDITDDLRDLRFYGIASGDEVIIFEQ